VFGTFERVDVRRSAGGVLWALFRPDGENSVDSIDVTIRRVPVSSDQLAIALRDTVEVMRFPGQARWKERPARLLEVTAWGGVQRAMSLDLLGRANVFPRHATVAAAARGEWVVVASGTGNVPARVRRAVLNAISALSVTAAPSPSPLSAVPPSP
jgi:hypothetical protein